MPEHASEYQEIVMALLFHHSSQQTSQQPQSRQRTEVTKEGFGQYLFTFLNHNSFILLANLVFFF
jgi:hypothetical protein